MYAVLALVATLLTSFLPIANKRLVQDARPALVAWAVNAASLPILAVGTFVVLRLTGGARVPRIDAIFLAALLASAALNWLATLLSTRALAAADASLVSPLLTFNPAFTLVVAWLTLGETPTGRGVAGVVLILVGAYLLDIDVASTGWLAPLRVLMQRPGTLLAILASALWGVTTVLEKIAILHVAPPSGPLVALLSTALTVVLLTPGAWYSRHGRHREHGEHRGPQRRRAGLAAHPRALTAAILIAGVAPLFGFTAIALGPVGYVTALFKVSAVLTIVWASVFLQEVGLRHRLLGTVVMLLGGALIAA